MAHRRAISRGLRAAATAGGLLLASACGDITLPGGATYTADLLPLGLQTTAVLPGSQTFWIYNNKLTVRSLRHADAFNTLYAEVRFPPGILASLDGTPLSTTDSVQVTLAPRVDGYGLTLSPSGLAFAFDATPTVTFSYARYADFSIVTGGTYATATDYEGAMDVWQEVTPGRWQVARGSAVGSGDVVTAAIDAPGRIMVAAPR